MYLNFKEQFEQELVAFKEPKDGEQLDSQTPRLLTTDRKDSQTPEKHILNITK